MPAATSPLVRGGDRDARQVVKPRASTDLLGLVSVACIVAFIAILCLVAANDPAEWQLLSVVITGLGAGGIILFRQLRKAANSLITSEARAQYAATHDPLTHLANKTMLVDRLRAVAQSGEWDHPGRPFGLLCVGLDRFGEVSQALGPDASDEVIVAVAARLVAVCREHDFVARLGDDVFALALPGRALAEGRAVGMELIERLGAPYRASTGQALIAGSVGMSFLTSEMTDPAEALRQAQLALASARKRGAGHFDVFDASMDQALKNRKALEVELRQALSDGGLSMVYQPQVNAKGALIGVEALMRWNSLGRGPISPSTFVPLSENCGLSDSLGRFALRHAFQDARNWPGLKVAINVSGAQIRSGQLVATLKTLLADTGANAQDFELEITEGVLLADEADTYDTLNAVRKLGFSLSLDDFGTGYSSLSYLRRFPVDKIKIDRSFVSHLGQRPESSAIVQAIVDMADALGLKVIAEGVETLDQVQRLTRTGCHQFQGFYFSRPVEAGAIGQLLAGRTTLAA